MSVNEYLEPTGNGTGELTEKRSRFIGRIWRVTSEAEARGRIEETRTEFHDARHHCWAYILKDGAVRYSDDGEPQGTAGQPMLELLTRRGILNVCCVVTRYFGGVLLGPGGLIRAYTEATKLALEDAGISQCRLWQVVQIVCPYNLYDRIRAQVQAAGCAVEDTEYGEQVTMTVLATEAALPGLTEALMELTAGSVTPVVTGERFIAVPL